MPEPPAVDDALREFLRVHLEALEQLVCLVLLHEEPRPWTASELAQRAGLPEALTEETLASLARGPFVTREPAGYRLAVPAEHLELVARLADVYRRAPIEVLKVISAQAIERVRGGALRAFADAFIIKTKKKTDG